MSASVSAKPTPPYNPAMLRWARKLAGVSVSAAAKRASVEEERIVDWERKSSSKVPTVRQARKLAVLYKRPFLEFFRKIPPILPDPVMIPDFRLFPETPSPSSTKELKDIQLWAEVQRADALDLYAEIGESPPSMPKTVFTTVDEDPETAAADARIITQFPIEDQVGRDAEGRRTIPAELRRKIEALGNLIFRRTDIKGLGVRGFCIAEFPLPVIVFGNEAPTAGAFTLLHEFAHVIIQQSAFSGPITRQGGEERKRKVEEWCNRFAGAFLMPRKAVADYLAPPGSPLEEIPDEILHDAALHFGVSDHAMLIRLVHLQYVYAGYYWTVKKPQFDAAEKTYRGGGRPLYYGTRFRNRQGELYTGLVLDAWAIGRITNHHAAEYMGIKNLRHLFDIREHFQRG